MSFFVPIPSSRCEFRLLGRCRRSCSGCRSRRRRVRGCTSFQRRPFVAHKLAANTPFNDLTVSCRHASSRGCLTRITASTSTLIGSSPLVPGSATESADELAVICRRGAVHGFAIESADELGEICRRGAVHGFAIESAVALWEGRIGNEV